MQKWNKITICLDMAGCPNRCKHCWIGISDSKPMRVGDLIKISDEFKNYTDKLEVNSWYREPDFRADYQRLYELENQLSTEKKTHFELVSFYRLTRDRTYAKWLYDIGVRKCQLTLFGDEQTTDAYIGRAGAYKEIITSVDILLNHGIAPRIQLFINQHNRNQFDSVVQLCKDWELEKRCREIGQSFALFVHAGSCDGENEKLYDIRVEPEDLLLLPDYIVDKTLDYMQKTSIQEVFGKEEYQYCNQSVDWTGYSYKIVENPVFYINGNFDVYPNQTTPYPWWKIGNLLEDGCKKILERYKNGDFFAVNMMKKVSFDRIVAEYGSYNSKKLFLEEDYYYFILNRFLRDIVPAQYDDKGILTKTIT